VAARPSRRPMQKAVVPHTCVAVLFLFRKRVLLLLLHHVPAPCRFLPMMYESAAQRDSEQRLVPHPPPAPHFCDTIRRHNAAIRCALSALL
jgi:hypothetical protein